MTTAVSSHVGSVIGAGTSNDSLLIGPDNVQPKQFFPSVSVNLTSRVALKIKVKIWANEYVEFRASLASTPQVDKYALSMTSSTAPSKQPRLTLSRITQQKRFTTYNRGLPHLTFLSLCILSDIRVKPHSL